MITIKIDENGKEALAQMNIDAAKNDTVMTAREKDELLGVGIMEIHKDFAILKSIHMNTEFDCFEMRFAIAKSMLNAVDLRGIRHVVADAFGDERLIAALRFKSVSECGCSESFVEKRKYYLNLDGYFTSNC